MASLLDLLGQTWPARLAKGAIGAAALPGDVYAGRVDPLSEEGIGKAADLAGMVMGGTFAGAPRGAVGAGPIRAYHGSPHDFERFDLSKIGTGEGAQAYGHGLYFAENPATAQSYRDTLASYKAKLPDDVISLPPEMRQAITTHARTDVDALTAAKRAQYMSSLLRQEDLGKLTNMVERIRDAERGRMYEVNINAQPEQFLDWDKTLTAQPANVQEALRRVGVEPTAPNLREQIDTARGLRLHAPQGGPSVYPGEIPDIRSPAATSAFREADVPGIKYLDQGSRRSGMANGLISQYGTPEKALEVAQQKLQAATSDFDRQSWTQAIDQLTKQKTSNYVLFRDDIISIIRKYGWAGLGLFGISPDDAKAAGVEKGQSNNLRIGSKTYGE